MAEVSVSTASRAFSRPNMVSPKTRARIIQVADSLGFSLSRSANTLRNGRTYRVALLMNDKPSLWFNAKTIEGLAETLRKGFYDISLYPIEDSGSSRRFFEDLPVKRNVDAIVVNSFAINSEQSERLMELNVPIMGINTPNWEGFAASSGIDDEHAMYLAAKHLINLGHRNIIYVEFNPGHDLRFSASRRLKGFMLACSQSADPVHYVIEQISRKEIDDNGDIHPDLLLDRIMSSEDRPSAICCQQDGIAIPLLCGLRRYGIEVPRDMSIVGIDDSTYAQDMGLTTVHQDPTAAARNVGEKLLTLLDGGTLEHPFETMPCNLVVRSSTRRVDQTVGV